METLILFSASNGIYTVIAIMATNYKHGIYNIFNDWQWKLLCHTKCGRKSYNVM